MHNSYFHPLKPRHRDEISRTLHSLSKLYQKLRLPPLKVKSLPSECVGPWVVETGGHANDSHFRLGESLRRHISRDHRKGTPIPERCAERVRTLTNLLVRMDAYPAAYGGFSDVWSCQLREKKSPPQRVAVKAIRWMTKNVEEFRLKQKAIEQELRVWAQLQHPNVLPLYGVTDEFGPFPAFVSPWADHGTLSEYLEKFESSLDLRKRLKLLRDIAAGLKYLHSRHVVHGDLSGSNVLVTESGRAVVSDFGLSILFDTTESASSFPGNIRWAAPELLDACVEGRSTSQITSRQADVYSFGSVMFQILTGKLPFHGVQRVAQIVVMISCGDRPGREPCWNGEAIPNALWQFVEKCWANPSERPSCRQIVAFTKHQLSGFFKGKRRSASVRRALRRRFRGTSGWNF